jgi:hypothetical protein
MENAKTELSALGETIGASAFSDMFNFDANGTITVDWTKQPDWTSD